MSETIRQRAITALATALATISTADGYETDAGSHVRVDVDQSQPLTAEASVGITVRETSGDERPGMSGEEHGVINLEVIGHAKGTADTDAIARRVAGDIKVAVGEDKTLGGLADDTIIEGVNFETSQGRERVANCTLTMRVHYRTTRFDPFTAGKLMAATVQGIFVAADTAPETRAVSFVRVPTPEGEEVSENVVTDAAVCRYPSSIGLVSLTLLPGLYRVFIGTVGAGQTYFTIQLEQSSGTLSLIDLVVGGTAAPAGLVGYFASLAAAKAYTRFVHDRVYYLASTTGFMSGQFHYDSTSTATADDSDTIQLTSVSGRLLRNV